MSTAAESKKHAPIASVDAHDAHAGHDHGHDHDHDHAGHNPQSESSNDPGHGSAGHSHDHSKASEGALKFALLLTSTVLIVEVIGGFWFHSLALLSDAMHMMTDTFALILALVAVYLARRAPDRKRTFGYARAEILAAAVNAALLFFVGFYILWEAYLRLRSPAPVATGGMLVVAIIGLVVNFIALRALAAGSEHSLNVKGAYLEVWADLVGSSAVIVAAIVIHYTGWLWVDPVLAALIGLWVLPRTWALLKESTHILLEGVPSDIDHDQVQRAIQNTPGVTGLHDLHIWSLSSGKPILTAHVEIASVDSASALQRELAEMLKLRFAIQHCTLQLETDRCAVACV